jgi:hypothetical protein
MNVIRLPFISCLAFLAIVACSRNDPVDDRASNTAGLPDINVQAPSTSGEPHADTEPATVMPKGQAIIPAAMQGRWGLTPADCMPGRSDAKGLMTITANDIRFYESRAVPGSDVQTSPQIMSGKFDFTGEGQSWTRYEAIKVDRDKLIRTESGPTASFTYAKCA